MTNLRMTCLSITIFIISLTLLLNCCSSSTIVVGSVYCDTCSHHYFSKSSHFISGAMVAIECAAGGGLNQNFTRVSQTNEKGEFQTHLPFSPKRHAKRIDHCSVKLIHSGDPNCTVPSASASAASPNVLILKSRKNGARTFSAGAFSFKPLNLPISCSQKVTEEENLNSIPDSPVISSPPSTASGFGVRPPSPDLFPSIPFQPTPPLISINIPPILNIPPLTNVLPLPTFPFKPVPGFPVSKENSP
ncbi:RNA-binding protein 12-like [Impatiens glandulifera]|uniref:RNA-binding protein 12-like n=1 Tax=Impatiens glandulifera TaxID=253017 RepID=UPI001FB129C2|nr:RNA-binding protein 12-like [Impatiens glandulifera]